MIEGSVAVVGASGFVGSTFVERLLHDRAVRVIPFIHSSGNAARLARHGIELRMVDVLSPTSLAEALRGCTYVVNCSRGDDAVMTRGFQNLIDASLAVGVRRLVHLSSVAVYGDTPPGEISESRRPLPDPGSYGAVKLQQDRMVEAAVRRGLPTVVICPPNISGAASPYVLEIVRSLQNGLFAIVDDGRLLCELVDVENLVHAMRLALDPRVSADGLRLFVTDCAAWTWRQLIESLGDLAERGEPRQLDRDEAARLAKPPRPPAASVSRSLRHLLSSDVRDVLRKDPLLGRAEAFGKSLVTATAPAQVQRALRRQANGHARACPSPNTPPVATLLLRHQLRQVRYSCSRAKEILGYSPVYSAEQSMDAFRRWYQETLGWDTASWPLQRHLYL